MKVYLGIAFCVVGMILGSLTYGWLSALASNSKLRVLELEQWYSLYRGALVKVPSGAFDMGDYDDEFSGSLWLKHEKNINLPLHRVELDGYFMASRKITNEDFAMYLKMTGRDYKYSRSSSAYKLRKFPQLPAYLDWYDAHAFCAWVASLNDEPFALPTEAQWEYAARNKGMRIPAATDNGEWRFIYHGEKYDHDSVEGLNVALAFNRYAFQKQVGDHSYFISLPVASFPPNPLGLYDMTDGGHEWVGDWYDSDYYQYSPVRNPAGPAEPVYKSPDTNDEYTKVYRGIDMPQYPILKAWTVYRGYANPSMILPWEIMGKKVKAVTGMTARCVLNIDPAA